MSWLWKSPTTSNTLNPGGPGDAVSVPGSARWGVRHSAEVTLGFMSCCCHRGCGPSQPGRPEDETKTQREAIRTAVQRRRLRLAQSSGWGTRGRRARLLLLRQKQPPDPRPLGGTHTTTHGMGRGAGVAEFITCPSPSTSWVSIENILQSTRARLDGC